METPSFTEWIGSVGLLSFFLFSLESQTCLVSSLNLPTACKNWGCPVLDWFNSPIYRLATTLWRTVLLSQNAKMGKKWHTNFQTGIWANLVLGAYWSPPQQLFGAANLQEPAVRPTVFSDRDTSFFPLSSKKKHGIYLQVLYLTTTCSTCNTSVYARNHTRYVEAHQF